MKLSIREIETIENRAGFRPIPVGHPVMDRLVKFFGEHTFYVDTGGLFVWEAAEGTAGCHDGVVVAVKLASWADEALSSLLPHEPQLTAVLVELASPS